MTAIVFSDFRLVTDYLPKPITVPSGETVASRKGKYLRVDGTTCKAMLGNASSSTEVGKISGFALSNERFVGDAVSLLRYGLVDVGDALDALGAGDYVYLNDTDSTFGTTAGTTSKTVGRVYPITESNGNIKKLLEVDTR